MVGVDPCYQPTQRRETRSRDEQGHKAGLGVGSQISLAPLFRTPCTSCNDLTCPTPYFLGGLSMQKDNRRQGWVPYWQLSQSRQSFPSRSHMTLAVNTCESKPRRPRLIITKPRKDVDGHRNGPKYNPPILDSLTDTPVLRKNDKLS